MIPPEAHRSDQHVKPFFHFSISLEKSECFKIQKQVPQYVVFLPVVGY